MKAFASWSGGKDSTLALFKAMNSGYKVEKLLNTINEDGSYSRSHGIRAEVLKKQAEAMGKEIVQVSTSWQDYEKNFKDAVQRLKAEGVEFGVFGDIDVEEHREWIERVCSEVGIKPVLPLWKMDREKVVREFVNLGFKAVVCSVKDEVLGKEWLGRELNESFIEEIKKEGVDVCGENGEYHTFVYDGPLFNYGLKLKFGKVLYRKGYYFLEIFLA